MANTPITITGIRARFPIFSQHPSLVYLDSGASGQKVSDVLDATMSFYAKDYANVHRGLYPLSERATERYEEARERVARLINALPEEVIFTSGTTDSINKAARMLCRTLKAGDEVLITVMEHHSNLVPWQELAQEYGLVLKEIPLNAGKERLDLDAARQLFNEKTKILAITHVSNVLGTINPIQELGKLARTHGAYTVIDGAQAIAHLPVDVKELGIDFYAFSGHKMYGPTGIGVLYGRKKLLEKLDPAAWGGEMVERVTMEKTTFAPPPAKFEPGTPNIAGAVGMGAAAEFLGSVGFDAIMRHERELLGYALERLDNLPGVAVLGPEELASRSGAIAFVVDGIHPHDVAHVLAMNDIAVRAGHHCAQPLHDALGIGASTRASIGIYNTKEDIDRFVEAARKAQEVFR